MVSKILRFSIFVLVSFLLLTLAVGTEIPYDYQLIGELYTADEDTGVGMTITPFRGSDGQTYYQIDGGNNYLLGDNLEDGYVFETDQGIILGDTYDEIFVPDSGGGFLVGDELSDGYAVSDERVYRDDAGAIIARENGITIRDDEGNIIFVPDSVDLSNRRRNDVIVAGGYHDPQQDFLFAFKQFLYAYYPDQVGLYFSVGDASQGSLTVEGLRAFREQQQEQQSIGPEDLAFSEQSNDWVDTILGEDSFAEDDSGRVFSDEALARILGDSVTDVVPPSTHSEFIADGYGGYTWQFNPNFDEEIGRLAAMIGSAQAEGDFERLVEYEAQFEDLHANIARIDRDADGRVDSHELYVEYTRQHNDARDAGDDDRAAGLRETLNAMNIYEVFADGLRAQARESSNPSEVYRKAIKDYKSILQGTSAERFLGQLYYLQYEQRRRDFDNLRQAFLLDGSETAVVTNNYRTFEYTFPDGRTVSIPFHDTSTQFTPGGHYTLDKDRNFVYAGGNRELYDQMIDAYAGMEAAYKSAARYDSQVDPALSYTLRLREAQMHLANGQAPDSAISISFERRMQDILERMERGEGFDTPPTSLTDEYREKEFERSISLANSVIDDVLQGANPATMNWNELDGVSQDALASAYSVLITTQMLSGKATEMYDDVRRLQELGEVATPTGEHNVFYGIQNRLDSFSLKRIEANIEISQYELSGYIAQASGGTIGVPDTLPLREEWTDDYNSVVNAYINLAPVFQGKGPNIRVTNNVIRGYMDRLSTIYNDEKSVLSDEQRGVQYVERLLHNPLVQQEELSAQELLQRLASDNTDAAVDEYLRLIGAPVDQLVTTRVFVPPDERANCLDCYGEYRYDYGPRSQEQIDRDRAMAFNIVNDIQSAVSLNPDMLNLYRGVTQPFYYEVGRNYLTDEINEEFSQGRQAAFKFLGYDADLWAEAQATAFGSFDAPHVAIGFAGFGTVGGTSLAGAAARSLSSMLRVEEAGAYLAAQRGVLGSATRYLTSEAVPVSQALAGFSRWEQYLITATPGQLLQAGVQTGFRATELGALGYGGYKINEALGVEGNHATAAVASVLFGELALNPFFRGATRAMTEAERLANAAIFELPRSPSGVYGDYYQVAYVAGLRGERFIMEKHFADGRVLEVAEIPYIGWGADGQLNYVVVKQSGLADDLTFGFDQVFTNAPRDEHGFARTPMGDNMNIPSEGHVIVLSADDVLPSGLKQAEPRIMADETSNTALIELLQDSSSVRPDTIILGRVDSLAHFERAIADPLGLRSVHVGEGNAVVSSPDNPGVASFVSEIRCPLFGSPAVQDENSSVSLSPCVRTVQPRDFASPNVPIVGFQSVGAARQTLQEAVQQLARQDPNFLRAMGRLSESGPMAEIVARRDYHDAVREQARTYFENNPVPLERRQYYLDNPDAFVRDILQTDETLSALLEQPYTATSSSSAVAYENYRASTRAAHTFTAEQQLIRAGDPGSIATVEPVGGSSTEYRVTMSEEFPASVSSGSTAIFQTSESRDEQARLSAAYEVDRVLGIGTTLPIAPFSFGGKEGTLRVSLDSTDAHATELGTTNVDDVIAMRVLLGEGAPGSNDVVSLSDGRIITRSHSEAFSDTTDIARLLDSNLQHFYGSTGRRLQISADLATRLALPAQRLESVLAAEGIADSNIDVLIARRDQLVDLLATGERIAVAFTLDENFRIGDAHSGVSVRPERTRDWLSDTEVPHLPGQLPSSVDVGYLASLYPDYFDARKIQSSSSSPSLLAPNGDYATNVLDILWQHSLVVKARDTLARDLSYGLAEYTLTWNSLTPFQQALFADFAPVFLGENIAIRSVELEARLNQNVGKLLIGGQTLLEANQQRIQRAIIEEKDISPGRTVELLLKENNEILARVTLHYQTQIGNELFPKGSMSVRVEEGFRGMGAASKLFNYIKEQNFLANTDELYDTLIDDNAKRFYELVAKKQQADPSLTLRDAQLLAAREYPTAKLYQRVLGYRLVDIDADGVIHWQKDTALQDPAARCTAAICEEPIPAAVPEGYAGPCGLSLSPAYEDEQVYLAPGDPCTPVGAAAASAAADAQFAQTLLAVRDPRAAIESAVARAQARVRSSGTDVTIPAASDIVFGKISVVPQVSDRIGDPRQITAQKLASKEGGNSLPAVIFPVGTSKEAIQAMADHFPLPLTPFDTPSSFIKNLADEDGTGLFFVDALQNVWYFGTPLMERNNAGRPSLFGNLQTTFREIDPATLSLLQSSSEATLRTFGFDSTRASLQKSLKAGIEVSARHSTLARLLGEKLQHALSAGDSAVQESTLREITDFKVQRMLLAGGGNAVEGYKKSNNVLRRLNLEQGYQARYATAVPTLVTAITTQGSGSASALSRLYLAAHNRQLPLEIVDLALALSSSRTGILPSRFTEEDIYRAATQDLLSDEVKAPFSSGSGGAQIMIEGKRISNLHSLLTSVSADMRADSNVPLEVKIASITGQPIQLIRERIKQEAPVGEDQLSRAERDRLLARLVKEFLPREQRKALAAVEETLDRAEFIDTLNKMIAEDEANVQFVHETFKTVIAERGDALVATLRDIHDSRAESVRETIESLRCTSGNPSCPVDLSAEATIVALMRQYNVHIPYSKLGDNVAAGRDSFNQALEMYANLNSVKACTYCQSMSNEEKAARTIAIYSGYPLDIVTQRVAQRATEMSSSLTDEDYLRLMYRLRAERVASQIGISVEEVATLVDSQKGRVTLEELSKILGRSDEQLWFIASSTGLDLMRVKTLYDSISTAYEARAVNLPATALAQALRAKGIPEFEIPARVEQLQDNREQARALLQEAEGVFEAMRTLIDQSAHADSDLRTILLQSGISRPRVENVVTTLVVTPERLSQACRTAGIPEAKIREISNSIISFTTVFPPAARPTLLHVGLIDPTLVKAFSDAGIPEEQANRAIAALIGPESYPSALRVAGASESLINTVATHLDTSTAELQSAFVDVSARVARAESKLRFTPRDFAQLRTHAMQQLLTELRSRIVWDHTLSNADPLLSSAAVSGLFSQGTTYQSPVIHSDVNQISIVTRGALPRASVTSSTAAFDRGSPNLAAIAAYSGDASGGEALINAVKGGQVLETYPAFRRPAILSREPPLPFVAFPVTSSLEPSLFSSTTHEAQLSVALAQQLNAMKGIDATALPSAAYRVGFVTALAVEVRNGQPTGSVHMSQEVVLGERGEIPLDTMTAAAQRALGRARSTAGAPAERTLTFVTFDYTRRPVAAIDAANRYVPTDEHVFDISDAQLTLKLFDRLSSVPESAPDIVQTRVAGIAVDKDGRANLLREQSALVYSSSRLPLSQQDTAVLGSYLSANYRLALSQQAVLAERGNMAVQALRTVELGESAPTEPVPRDIVMSAQTPLNDGVARVLSTLVNSVSGVERGSVNFGGLLVPAADAAGRPLAIKLLPEPPIDIASTVDSSVETASGEPVQDISSDSTGLEDVQPPAPQTPAPSATAAAQNLRTEVTHEVYDALSKVPRLSLQSSDPVIDRAVKQLDLAVDLVSPPATEQEILATQQYRNFVVAEFEKSAAQRPDLARAAELLPDYLDKVALAARKATQLSRRGTADWNLPERLKVRQDTPEVIGMLRSVFYYIRIGDINNARQTRGDLEREFKKFGRSWKRFNDEILVSISDVIDAGEQVHSALGNTVTLPDETEFRDSSSESRLRLVIAREQLNSLEARNALATILATRPGTYITSPAGAAARESLRFTYLNPIDTSNIQRPSDIPSRASIGGKLGESNLLSAYGQRARQIAQRRPILDDAEQAADLLIRTPVSFEAVSEARKLILHMTSLRYRGSNNENLDALIDSLEDLLRKRAAGDAAVAEIEAASEAVANYRHALGSLYDRQLYAESMERLIAAQKALENLLYTRKPATQQRALDLVDEIDRAAQRLSDSVDFATGTIDGNPIGNRPIDENERKVLAALEMRFKDGSAPCTVGLGLSPGEGEVKLAPGDCHLYGKSHEAFFGFDYKVRSFTPAERTARLNSLLERFRVTDVSAGLESVPLSAAPLKYKQAIEEHLDILDWDNPYEQYAIDVATSHDPRWKPYTNQPAGPAELFIEVSFTTGIGGLINTGEYRLPSGLIDGTYYHKLVIPYSFTTDKYNPADGDVSPFLKQVVSGLGVFADEIGRSQGIFPENFPLESRKYLGELPISDEFIPQMQDQAHVIFYNLLRHNQYLFDDLEHSFSDIEIVYSVVPEFYDSVMTFAHDSGGAQWNYNDIFYFLHLLVEKFPTQDFEIISNPFDTYWKQQVDEIVSEVNRAKVENERGSTLPPPSDGQNPCPGLSPALEGGEEKQVYLAPGVPCAVNVIEAVDRAEEGAQRAYAQLRANDQSNLPAAPDIKVSLATVKRVGQAPSATHEVQVPVINTGNALAQQLFVNNAPWIRTDFAAVGQGWENVFMGYDDNFYIITPQPERLLLPRVIAMDATLLTGFSREAASADSLATQQVIIEGMLDDIASWHSLPARTGAQELRRVMKAGPVLAEADLLAQRAYAATGVANEVRASTSESTQELHAALLPFYTAYLDGSALAGYSRAHVFAAIPESPLVRLHVLAGDEDISMIIDAAITRYAFERSRNVRSLRPEEFKVIADKHVRSAESNALAEQLGVSNAPARLDALVEDFLGDPLLDYASKDALIEDVLRKGTLLGTPELLPNSRPGAVGGSTVKYQGVMTHTLKGITVEIPVIIKPDQRGGRARAEEAGYVGSVLTGVGDAAPPAVVRFDIPVERAGLEGDGSVAVIYQLELDGETSLVNVGLSRDTVTPEGVRVAQTLRAQLLRTDAYLKGNFDMSLNPESVHNVVVASSGRAYSIDFGRAGGTSIDYDEFLQFQRAVSSNGNVDLYTLYTIPHSSQYEFLKALGLKQYYQVLGKTLADGKQLLTNEEIAAWRERTARQIATYEAVHAGAVAGRGAGGSTGGASRVEADLININRFEVKVSHSLERGGERATILTLVDSDGTLTGRAGEVIAERVIHILPADSNAPVNIPGTSYADITTTVYHGGRNLNARLLNELFNKDVLDLTEFVYIQYHLVGDDLTAYRLQREQGVLSLDAAANIPSAAGLRRAQMSVTDVRVNGPSDVSLILATPGNGANLQQIMAQQFVPPSLSPQESSVTTVVKHPRFESLGNFIARFVPFGTSSSDSIVSLSPDEFGEDAVLQDLVDNDDVYDELEEILSFDAAVSVDNIQENVAGHYYIGYGDEMAVDFTALLQGDPVAVQAFRDHFAPALADAQTHGSDAQGFIVVCGATECQTLPLVQYSDGQRMELGFIEREQQGRRIAGYEFGYAFADSMQGQAEALTGAVLNENISFGNNFMVVGGDGVRPVVDPAQGLAALLPDEICGDQSDNDADGSVDEDCPGRPIIDVLTSASALTARMVRVSWTDNSTNEDGFVIERSILVGTTRLWSYVGSVGRNNVTFIDTKITGLQPSTSYQYRVRAYNVSLGYSLYSTPAPVTTLAAPALPAAPTTFSATSFSRTTLQLNWADNSDNEEGFLITYSTTQGSAGQQVYVGAYAGTGVRSSTLSGLQPGTLYYLTVAAFNYDGDQVSSSVSASATTLTVNPPPPAAPSGASTRSCTTSAVSVSWTDNANNEEGFIVNRTPSDQTYWFGPVGSSGNSISFVDRTGLSAGTTYTYKIASFNAGGEQFSSSSSTSATVTSVNPPTPATPAFWLQAKNSSAIRLYWTDLSDNEEGFIINRTSSGNSWTEIARFGSLSGSGGTAQWDDSGLAAGTPYTYSIQSFNGCGEIISWGVSVAATTLANDPPLPAAPSNLAATACGNSVRLSWTDNSNDEEGFILERSVDQATWTSYVLPAQTGTGLYETVDSSVAASTIYYYRVKASKLAGDSVYNANGIQSVNTGVVAPNPNAPSDLTLYSVDRDTIVLTFVDRSTDETEFIYERTIKGANQWQAFGITSPSSAGTGTALTISDNGLQAQTEYEYRVYASRSNACVRSGYNVNGIQSARTRTTGLAAPQSVGAEGIGINQINVSWRNSDGNARDFAVYRTSNEEGGVPTRISGTIVPAVDQANGLNNLRVFSLVDSAPKVAGRAYYYWVTTKNLEGIESENSISAGAINPTLATPADFRALFGGQGMAADRVYLSFSWNAVAGADSYVLCRIDPGATPVDGDCMSVANAPTLAAPLNIPNVEKTRGDPSRNLITAPVDSYFYVYARNSVSGAVSALSERRYARAPLAPATAGGVIVCNAGGGGYRFRWSDIADNEEYFKLVEYQASGGQCYPLTPGQVLSTRHMCPPSGWCPNIFQYTAALGTLSSTKCYKVHAVNAYGDSPTGAWMYTVSPTTLSC